MQLDRATLLEAYRRMATIRAFEERVGADSVAGLIPGFVHLYVGEEAVAAGSLRVLDTDDAVIATYREHAHALLRGIPMTKIMAEMFGKQEGCSGGRGGSMHLFDAGRRFYGGNAIVAAGLPLAAGLAFADKQLGRNRVSACYFGEGATAEGAFHETMNMAELWQLPVLFCCENNRYAMGTAIDRELSQVDLVAKAESYRVPAASADGMDVLDSHAAMQRAVDHIRTTGGPFFLAVFIAIVSALCLTDADKTRLVARPLREYFPSRTYGVLVRKGKTLSNPARAFVDLIKPGLFRRKDWFEAGHSER